MSDETVNIITGVTILLMLAGATFQSMRITNLGKEISRLREQVGKLTTK